MKKRTFRLGCLIAGLLVLIVLVAGGGWWFFRPLSNTTDAPLSSPVNVFIISPSSGDELNAGDFASISVQAFAPEAIQNVELFVDGVSLGAVSDSPQNTFWTWQAWPVGIHTLVAHATSAHGQVGQSQTVIVSVLAGDGKTEVAAQDGQTLEQVGSNFGVPLDQMASANPKIDPALPLKDGQLVQVPVAGTGASNPSGAGSGPAQPAGGAGQVAGSIPIQINWQFQPKEPVDKSYCYSSAGDGNWEKMPKEPFNFFYGDLLTQYPSYAFYLEPGENTIYIQCWGWLDNSLKFLGEGQGKLNLSKPGQQVNLIGAGFQLVGMPQFTPEPEQFMGGSGVLVPPPYALREPSDEADCTSHGNPLLSGFVCNTLLNAPVKEYIILEWEWQPKTCWPGQDCNWLDDISGFSIYEVNPFSKFSKHMKDVTNPAQKVTALPLPWGFSCYAVEAYAEHPENGSKVVSPKTIYCPDDPPEPEKTTLLPPTNWVTTSGEWIELGGCGGYGSADYYLLENQNKGFGNQAGEVLVGSYLVQDGFCYKEGQYSAGVKFNVQPDLLPGAVIQKAVLRFSKVYIDYKSPGIAGSPPYSCVSAVGEAKQDWSGLSNGNHFSSQFLATPSNNIPIASVGTAQSQVDVTAAVSDWFKHPENNHGFILTPASAPVPKQPGTGECLSGLGNFELDIYYFAP